MIPEHPIGSFITALLLLGSAHAALAPPHSSPHATTPPSTLSPCCGAITLASCYGYNVNDSTAYLQEALACPLARVLKIDIPASGGAWNVQPLFLTRSNLVIVFEPGAIVRAVRGAFQGTGACLMTVLGARNITIEAANTTFQMWRSDYANHTLYNHSEWRHGLSILNSTEVSVTGLTVIETGGDCIYVGAHSSDIAVISCNMTAGFRNAMSVTGVAGLLVQDSILADTGGTCCMSGVDLEPGTVTECVRDVIFRNCTFTGNYMNQVTISLHNQEDVVDSILFDNCTVSNSALGGIVVLSIGGASTKPAHHLLPSGARGNLTLRDVTVVNTRDYGLSIMSGGGPYASFTVENINLTNVAQAGHMPILIEGGNVNFVGGSVTDDHNRAFLVGGWRTTTGVQNITGAITVYNTKYSAACVPVYIPANVSTGNDLQVTCNPAIKQWRQ